MGGREGRERREGGREGGREEEGGRELEAFAVRLFWRPVAVIRGFWAGCSKTAEIIPSSTAATQLTTQVDRNDAQTRRFWNRGGFNPEKKTGRDVSDQICGLNWKKIRCETSLKKSNPKFNEKK